MISYEVKFKKGNEVASIKLYSHYTCIVGKYSGEGKSEFLAEIAEEVAVGNSVFDSELPVSIADALSLPGILDNPNRQIIIIDELAMLQSNMIKKINNSHHLFIGISRGNPVRLEYPLKSIYSVERSGDWFNIKSLESELPLIDRCKDCKVVMESRKGKSEHELLGKYFSKCVPASGRNNLEKFLRDKEEEIHVFADLGAIGNAFTLLRKRCKDNPKIRFYYYQAFEQLLTESPLLREYNIVANPFDFMSLEKYFEYVLEKMLEQNGIKFKHGDDLPEFVKTASEEELFDSEAGRKLLEYVSNKHGKANIKKVNAF